MFSCLEFLSESLKIQDVLSFGHETSRIGAKGSCDLIANFAKDSKLFFFGPFCMSRIKEWPVVSNELTREVGASLISITANGDDCFHSIGKKGIPSLRFMSADIEVDFGHSSDC